jgi:restriction endonuclease Mrr
MNSSSLLRRELEDIIAGLSYPAWIAILQLLLERMGYQDVQPSRRSDRLGRHRDGGCDLTAVLPVPGGKRRVIVQAKQYPAHQPVMRRMVDELRGVCLRARAAEGILITTGSFVQSLSLERCASLPLLPIRLIDGSELLELLIEHKVGVWEDLYPDAITRERGVDLHFFAELEEATNKASTGPAVVASRLPKTRRRKLVYS